MMATRTTTTRTTRIALEQSADESDAAFTFSGLVQAYFDCRHSKRNSLTALTFEQHLEHNLIELDAELRAGTYQPGRSICFVVTHPKPREVWAAEFRDRIVHHLLYNHVAPSIEARFIADSCACIKGRGTLYAVNRLEGKIRSITQNWQKPAHYLKLDLANFFVSIDKNILAGLLIKHIAEPWWQQLALQILWHDPRQNFTLQSSPAAVERVPAHKRLTNHPEYIGLPIGNLSSQFFANVYLNELDQFAKHQIGARYYVRYVDDFILLHESPQWLNDAKTQIEGFLPTLAARINPKKTILQPVARGVDFVGQVIKPWRRTTRRKTFHQGLQRIYQSRSADLFETSNSYFGLLRQASHSHTDRTRLANLLRKRGQCINFEITKTYRRAA